MIDPEDEAIVAAERERALQAEIERLLGKCNRLIGAADRLNAVIDTLLDMEGMSPADTEAMIPELRPGDMRPEPHDAASEGEVSQCPDT